MNRLPSCIAVVWLVFPASLLAEQQSISRIDQAYQRTKSAETAEDYAAVIQLCRKARQRDLNQEQTAYIARLLSWAHNRRGEVYVEEAASRLETGDEEGAAELDAKALSDFETAVKHDATRWKALHNRGVSYALAGKYEEALADFTRAIELKPSYANAWFNRGEIRYELGQLEEALADYTQTIELKPSDFGAYTSRGHTYFRLRRFRDSLEDYSRAMRLESSNADAYANRGDAYQSLGMWERAASDFRRAIDLDPEAPRAYQSAAWLMATCPDPRYRKGQLAVEAAQQAVDLAPQVDHRYLDTLAAAQANAGQFEQARETLAKAIELAPEDEVAPLEERLKLYAENRPYRQNRNQDGGSGEEGALR